MRERHKFSNQKRRPQPPQSAGVVQRLGEVSYRNAQTQRQRDRKSSGGNLFALFGVNDSGKQPVAAPQRRQRNRNNRSVFDQLPDLRPPIARRNTPKPAGRAKGKSTSSVIALQEPASHSRRQQRRRTATAPKPQKQLLSLPRPRTASGKFLLYGIRLLVFGVGIGVIAGTILSVWDPASRLTANSTPNQPSMQQVKPVASLKLGQEIGDLKTKISTLVTQKKDMQAGVMLLDLDTNAYVDLNATTPFPAASTIKFPVLVAFFQDVDAGKIQLDEMLTMTKAQVAPESGTMQYQPVGTKFSAIETATQMMVISDNTATNMIIDRVGGMAALNERFRAWGMTSTMLHNPLPDIQGTNTTSPKDMTLLMSQVQDGKLISMKSRDRLLDIMRHIENDSMLPQGLGKGATIAHKTGSLGTLLGDVGLIDTPNGKRYLATVIVKRPRDDASATELVQQISRLAYQQLNQSQNTSSAFNQAGIAQSPN